MYNLIKRLNPGMYQGGKKERNYFEGWYFKLIDAVHHQVLAVIPGVSYGKKPWDAHAFIQVVDAVNCNSWYLTYPIDTFWCAADYFQIRVGDSTFGSSGVDLKLEGNGISIQGVLHFQDILSFPRTLLNPGIMGPFTFVPFMECYHDILHIQHEIRGSLRLNGQFISFNGGNGYIEKDWGHSFPEAWVWVQCNHFQVPGTCLMLSIARIPWLGSHFTGFLFFLMTNGRLYRLATYTRAKIQQFTFEQNSLHTVIESPAYRLDLKAFYSQHSLLKAPEHGRMNREIGESISSHVEVELQGSKGEILFSGTGELAGMEVSGDLSRINV